MKKLIMLLSLLVISTVVFSQEQQQQQQRKGPPSAEQRIERATKELSLTDRQVKEWENIFSRYESDLKGKPQNNDARKAMSKELEATLTEVQLEKFQAMKKKQGPPPGRR